MTRVPPSRRDVMFIERAGLQRFLLAPAERNGCPSCGPFPETLRSAGARFVDHTGFYKHWAPLEPKHHLVAASAALCNLCFFANFWNGSLVYRRSYFVFFPVNSCI